MSDSNLAERRNAPAKTRSRTVKPGHLEVGEITSGRIGASSPFGSAPVPMPVSSVYFEHTPPVGTRILDDERH